MRTVAQVACTITYHTLLTDRPCFCFVVLHPSQVCPTPSEVSQHAVEGSSSSSSSKAGIWVDKHSPWLTFLISILLSVFGLSAEPGADYRFVSLRDASFTAAAFLRLGFRNEVNAWMGWLAARCAESQEADGKMQQVYGLRGETKLDAIVLPDVPGYKNSGPVTIGHSMSDRSTIDHYGAILISMYLSNKYCDPMSYETWTVTRKLVNYVCDHWADPVAGLWPDDANREPSHYLAAKLMCWVCLDRGIHLAQDRSFPAPLHEWRRIRNEIYCDIQDKGYNASLKRYTAAYDNTHLDVALLLMPITSFVAPTDPKFMSTLDAILKSVSDGQRNTRQIAQRQKTGQASSCKLTILVWSLFDSFVCC